MDAYSKKIEELYIEIEKECENHQGWELIKDHDGVRVWTKIEENSPIKCAKANGIVQISPDDIYKILAGMTDYHKETDKFFKGGRELQVFDENHSIVTCRYSAGVMLISDRDFVFLEARKHYPDSSKTIANFSVDHPDAPEVSGVVRAHIYKSGWVIKPYTPSEEEAKKSGVAIWTEATFIGQVDIKGWLPVWVINMLSSEVGGSIYNVRTYIEKKKSKK